MCVTRVWQDPGVQASHPVLAMPQCVEPEVDSRGPTTISGAPGPQIPATWEAFSQWKIPHSCNWMRDKRGLKRGGQTDFFRSHAEARRRSACPRSTQWSRMSRWQSSPLLSRRDGPGPALAPPRHERLHRTTGLLLPRRRGRWQSHGRQSPMEEAWRGRQSSRHALHKGL